MRFNVISGRRIALVLRLRCCICGVVDFVFGVGAESRNTPWPFPPGHGYIVEDGTEWFANIHLLNTIGLAGGPGGAKECIECWWVSNAT